MKKTVAGVVVGLMVLAFSAPCASAAMPYLSGSTGYAALDDSSITPRSYDSGPRFSGAVGLDGAFYRLEAEFGSQQNKVKSSVKEVSMRTYMAKCYYDIELPLAPVKPFLAAGAGFANIDEDNGVGSIVGDRVLAWQIGAGVGFSIFPLVTLDVQYRHFATSDTELGAGQKYSISSNNVVLGLRVGL
jgi:opacity protein-like surface antigen